MAKVLLVDTNFSSQPIYRALESMGHEVHVVGNNPMDCLAKFAGHYWQQDYSDTEALAGLIDSQQFDYLVPGCTDRSYASCVAAGRGRFPGIDDGEAAAAISHKGRFRELAGRIGLPVPRNYLDSEPMSAGAVIVKPVDSFSGKGITVLRDDSPQQLEQARSKARQASSTGDCLVQEFVDGQLYSYSAFLSRRKVIASFLVQEDCTVNPFVVDTSRVLAADEHGRLHALLQADIENIAEHLNLVDGLLHTQFIDDGSSHWLIELTRRCPGDLYSMLVEYSTEFPYASCYAETFLGTPATDSSDSRLKPVMRHTMTVSSGQVLGHVSFRRPVMIESLVPLSLAGDPLEGSPSSRVAVLFCREDSALALDELYRSTLRRELYEVVDGAV